MKYPLFNVGDKVMVRKDLSEYGFAVYVTARMLNFAGKTVTIKYIEGLGGIDKDGEPVHRYRIREDGQYYIWSSDLFIGLELDTTATEELKEWCRRGGQNMKLFKVGDKVTVRMDIKEDDEFMNGLYTIYEEHEKFRGRIVTISGVTEHQYGKNKHLYTIEEDEDCDYIGELFIEFFETPKSIRKKTDKKETDALKQWCLNQLKGMEK